MTELLNTMLDEQSMHDIDTPNYALRRSVAVGAAALSVVGVFAGIKAGEHIVDRIITPIEYSDTTTTYTVQQNEGLDAVTSKVAGINSVDFNLVKEHIRTSPENIDILSDKVIQVNETFVIPAEVKKR
ncbi:MAG: hypothetical protein JWM07_271 [Candidatus Saccharibacteria bacterium]|nr:hypothetical protein [Candidatus Saccharibacteria bacterium]